MNRSISTYLLAILMLALVGQASHAGEVTLAQGAITLNARLELADGKTLKDGVILMTHGTLAHNGMEIIQTLQGLLNENGLNTLAINLGLGLNERHGMYPCETLHTHKHTDALDEIGAWIEWLKGQGADSIVLLGHSRGGNQVTWFAVERNEPAVKAAVLVAPQTWDEASEARAYETRYDKPLGPLLEKAQALVKAGKADTVLEHTDFIYCADTKVTAGSFAAYYTPDARFDTPSLLPGIGMPVLVFSGTEDKAVTGLADKLSQLENADQVEHVAIDGADHYFRDLYAEDVVDAMVDFLGRF
ncbi:MAG: alpha/beta fold hydrolase [Gammaproteobacteria bacterium]|nr:alpha/beta fold hydrolase [Gammaproteobacteria bacterium]